MLLDCSSSADDILTICNALLASEMGKVQGCVGDVEPGPVLSKRRSQARSQLRRTEKVETDVTVYRAARRCVFHHMFIHCRKSI